MKGKPAGQAIKKPLSPPPPPPLAQCLDPPLVTKCCSPLIKYFCHNSTFQFSLAFDTCICILSVSVHYKNKTISFSCMIHLVKKSIRA